MAGIRDNGEEEIPTLSGFNLEQSNDAGGRNDFASVWKRNTCSNVDSDRVLVRAFSLNRASQRVVHASCAPVLLTSITILCKPVDPAKADCTITSDRSCTVTTEQIRSSLLYFIATPAHRAVRTTNENRILNYSFQKDYQNTLLWTYWDSHRDLVNVTNLQS